MAVTRLLRIKETKGNNRASHLKKNIFYICRDDKTGNGLWIGGNAGSTPDVIYWTMVENKKFWCKEDGSQAFHYMLSFPPDCGVDEATAFQIVEEFCGELLGRTTIMFSQSTMTGRICTYILRLIPYQKPMV